MAYINFKEEKYVANKELRNRKRIIVSYLKNIWKVKI